MDQSAVATWLREICFRPNRSNISSPAAMSPNTTSIQNRTVKQKLWHNVVQNSPLHLRWITAFE